MTVITKLSEEILKSKRSISDISRKSGISRPMIYMILKGEVSKVSSETIEAICKTLEISPANIYSSESVAQQYEEMQENIIRIVGRGGVIKEYKVTDKERKMFEAMLEAEDDDPDLKY